MVCRRGQDPAVLREEAYADDAKLDVRRRTHELYTLDPVDFCRWTLERLPWRGDERVLDVGCGPGDLLRKMARQHGDWGLLAGLDSSGGMITEAVAAAANLAVCFTVGDAQSLPFPEGTFDVVMARHMLYHVADIGRAVAEAGRVLRGGGHFLVTTNSAHTMPEYEAIRRRAAARFPIMIEPEMVTGHLCLENAPAYLERHFDRVETHILPGTLRFPDAQPFVDYFASTRSLSMGSGHGEAEWQAILRFVRAEAEAIVAEQGHLDVSKVTGAIVGVKGG
jgi:SAM-dependent methyltransferase